MTPNNPSATPPPDDASQPGGSSGSPPANQGGAAPVKQPPPRKRRRRWPYVVGGLLILILLLVALVPTIVGTGFVRSMVLGKVNQNLNGKLEVADWSYSWGGNLHVDGLKLFDAAGRQILELPHLSGRISLWNLMHGRYDFGKLTIDGLDFWAVRESDGTLNFAKLAKSAAAPGSAAPAPHSSPAAQPQDSGQAKAAGREPEKLPEIRGEIVLVNCRGTFDDVQKKQSVKLSALNADVKIPDINQPIENTLEAVAAVDGAESGRLTLGGRILLVKNNVLMTDPEQILHEADVDERVSFAGFDLASASPFFGPSSGLDHLAGKTDGHLNVTLRPLSDCVIEAAVQSTGLQAGGPALKGDTLAARTFDLTIPRTTIVLSPGSSDADAARLQTGDEKNPITLVLVQGPDSTSRLAFFADVTPRALKNLAANRKPGDPGRIRADVDIDAAHLATSMPHFFKLVPGVHLSSGRIQQSTALDMSSDRLNVQQRLQVTGVAGRNTIKQTDIVLKPIDESLKLTDLGGGGALPDVRDVLLDLTSGFATAKVTAANLGDLHAEAHGMLDQVQRELGQVIDFGAAQLAGTFDVNVSSKGDLVARPATAPAGQPATADVSSQITLTGLRVTGLQKLAAIEEPSFSFTATGQLQRGTAQFIDQINQLTIAARGGSAEHPTLDTRLYTDVRFRAGTVADATTHKLVPVTEVLLPAVKLLKLDIDLAQAQQKYGALVPALQQKGLQVRGGTLSAIANGSYDGTTLTADATAGLSGLTLDKFPVPATATAASGAAAPLPVAAPSQHVLTDYSLNLQAAGAFGSRAGGTTVSASRLELSDNQKLIAAKKVNDGNLQISITPDGGMYPTGKLEIAADLKGINDLLRNLSAGSAAPVPQVVARDERGVELRSGRLAGTIAFAPAAERRFLVSVLLDATGITLDGPGSASPLQDEKLNLALDVSARDDLSAVDVGRLDAGGSLLSAHVVETSIQLATGGKDGRPVPLMQMLRKANATIYVPSVPKVKAVLDALSPPAAPTAVPIPTAGAAPAPPLRDGVLALAAKLPPPNTIDGTAGSNAAQAAEPPAKVDFTSGSATIGLIASRDGQRLVLTPTVAAKDLAFTAAKNVPVDPAKPAGPQHVRRVNYVMGLVDLSTQVSILPADLPASQPAASAPPPSLPDQIRELQVAKLVARGAGAEVSLKQPLQITDLAGLSRIFPTTRPTTPSPASGSLAAALSIKGDLAVLSRLLEALAAEEPGTKYPYSGAYAFEQNLSASNGALAFKGAGGITDFQVHDGQAVSFTEPSVKLTDDLSMDGTALTFNDLSVAMQSSKAFSLVVTGAVADLQKRRELRNLSADLTYDLAPLWKIIYPMLSKEGQASWKDLELAGQYTKHFTVSGAYPAGVPSNVAMRSVSARGGFTIGTLKGQGMDLRDLDLPLVGTNGIFRVAFSDRPGDYPKPASLNGGQFAVVGATLDLTDPHPRLSLIPGTYILRDVNLNPALAAMLGEKFGNFLFAGANQASGVMSAVALQCDRLPLDNLASQQTPENDGKLILDVSIKDLNLASSSVKEITDKLTAVLRGIGQLGASKALAPESLRGDVKNYRIVLDHGVTTHDMTLTFGENARPLHLAGDVVLSSMSMKMTLNLPWSLFRLNEPQLAALAPSGVQLPVTGEVTRPKFDAGLAVQKTFVSNPQDLFKELPGLFGPRKK